jgi:hypothetical protein
MFGVLDVFGLLVCWAQTHFRFECIYCLEKLIGVLFSICSTRGFNSESRNPIFALCQNTSKTSHPSHFCHIVDTQRRFNTRQTTPPGFSYIYFICIFVFNILDTPLTESHIFIKV